MARSGKKLAEAKIWLRLNMETLQRTANRGSVSTGYDIDNSLKLEADNVEYLQKANDAGTNRKTFTVSMWFKRTELANDYMTLWQGGENGEATRLGFYGGTPKEAIWVDIGGGTGNTGTLSRSYSTQVLRDTSAFYHIVLAVDTTQATEANRWKLWLNGEEVTSWAARNYPAQDFQCAVEASINMHWGAYNSTYYKMCGYIAECHYLDGVAKVQTDFGEYDEDSGIWIPKAYTGTYGGNGCYLNFDDSASLGADSSGNSNTFTLNNIAAADQATDTPTNNFCTWSPLWRYLYQPIISEGGTKAGYSDSTDENAKGSIGVINGKWYWEAKPVGTIGSQFIGIQTANTAYTIGSQGLTQNYTMVIEPQGRYYSYSGSLSESSAGQFTALSTSSWLGIALDMDSATKTIKYYVDGSLILTLDLISDMQDRTVFPFLQNYESRSFYINFGGYTLNTISSAASDANGYGTFEYAPPTGYYALCTKNLAEYG
mgnify:CR=1 FL=1